ncbi:hypothetical protein FB451DRAFT_1245470 [Mycena latifolia]|nr:hypothetical protein FB451DRAFT_1245470 [Mycena latifolia]
MKRFKPHQYEQLAMELAAHQRLAALRPRVVACAAVIAARDLTWMAMLMPDAGPSVASAGGFAEIPWTDRRDLHRTVLEIHRAGIAHGAITAHHVLRSADGALCVADFGAAQLEHRCGEWMCAEVDRLMEVLRGEDEAEDEEVADDSEE